MDSMKGLIEACEGITEAVRPAGQGDVALATDEVAILFEAPEDARVIYDMLTGAGGGVKLLEPGEVMLHVIPEWNQASLNFTPMVRYLKPEIIAAVLEAIGDYVEESALEDAELSLAEDMEDADGVLVEFNPYHDKGGNFTSPGRLKRAKAGSYSVGKRKNKVSAKGKKKLKLVATKLPCGRDARKRGINQRCWDGKKLSWTGHAVARVIKKAKKLGRVEGVLTADDRVILERAVSSWARRAEMVEK